MSADLVAFLKARLDEDKVVVTERWGEGGGRDAREVEAKRAILAEHDAIYPAVAHQAVRGVPDPASPRISVFAYCHVCDDEAPCPTVRTLAAIYSDHPDYREEWKP